MPFSTANYKIPASSMTNKSAANYLPATTAKKIPASSSTNPYVANYKPTVAGYGTVNKGIPTTTTTTSSNNNNNDNKPSGGSASDNIAQKAEAKRLEAERKQQESELNDIYGGIMDYIGQQRKALQSNKAQLMQLATSPYEQAIPAIEAETEKAVAGLGQTASKVGREKESALDQARRMYGELSTRNLQMFGGGGASSTGQAASELLSQEQMRNTGDIQQQAQDQLQNIEMQITNINREKDVKLRELDMQKNQAITQAELNFRDQLAQIDQMEFETKQNKKVEKINLLRQYRQDLSDTNRYFRELQNQVVSTASAYETQVSQGAQDYMNMLNERSNVQTGINQPLYNQEVIGYPTSTSQSMLPTGRRMAGGRSIYEDIYNA